MKMDVKQNTVKSTENKMLQWDGHTERMEEHNGENN
jgi:hypothetical protein